MPICADTVGISGPRLSQTPSTLYVPHSTLSSILHADQRHTGRGGHRRSRVFSIRAHRTCEPLHVWRHGTSPHESCTDRASIMHGKHGAERPSIQQKRLLVSHPLCRPLLAPWWYLGT